MRGLGWLFQKLVDSFFLWSIFRTGNSIRIMSFRYIEKECILNYEFDGEQNFICCTNVFLCYLKNKILVFGRSIQIAYTPGFFLNFPNFRSKNTFFRWVDVFLDCALISLHFLKIRNYLFFNLLCRRNYPVNLF